jgi:hypothetical protein
MESQCLQRIRVNSKETVFPRTNQSIVIKGDTIKFEKSLIFLRQSEANAFLILKEGLIFPELILGASTTSNHAFKISNIAFIGTLVLSSFHQLEVPAEAPATKTFSFLLWRENWANPVLYVLQITNDKAGPSASFSEFIKGAKLSAFGFCSVLI